MSEAELLELAAISRSNIAFLVTQIIAVHFALVAGIYLFFNRASIFLKVAILILYTSGYGGLLGLFFWEQAAANGVGNMLAAIPEKGIATDAILDWSRDLGRLQATSSIVIYASGWFIVAFALFFPIKRDSD